MENSRIALINAAFSAFTDVYLATYPLTVVYRLKISVQKKVGLSAVLCLGLVWVMPVQMLRLFR